VLVDLASRDGPHLDAARGIFAKRFRFLWWGTDLTALLTQSALAIASHRFWPEGWVATRMGLKFPWKDGDLTALQALEDRLRPRTLVEKVRTYGGVSRMGFDLEDVEDLDDDVSPGNRTEVFSRSLGAALVADPTVRSEVLPQLLEAGVQRPYAFGEGMARATTERRALWNELVEAIRARPVATADPTLLRAYLRTWNELEPGVAEPLLDEILHDPLLGRWLPLMQTALPGLNSAGVGRIKTSFTLGHTNVLSYHVLMFGGTLDALAPEDYAEILTNIAQMPDGIIWSLQFFHRRTYSEAKKEKLAEPILAVGRSILRVFPLDDNQGREDSHLGDLAELCLPGPYADLALRTLRRLAVSVNRYGGSIHTHDQLVAAIVDCHPQTALDFFLGADEDRRRRRGPRRLLGHLGISRLPLASLSTESLLTWVAKAPGERHRRVAEHIPLFVGRDKEDGVRWWEPALALLNDAPDPAPVLSEFTEHLTPTSWSGSLAEILERRSKALHQLDGHESEAVREWARSSREELARRIADDRSRVWRRDQSFE
jgi:hypothetical protein